MGNLVALSHPTQKPTRNLTSNSFCYIHLFDQKTHTINMSVSKIRTNFHANSEEERDHAMKLIKYQNMRGGRVVFQDVAKAKTDDWISALSAVEASLELEKKVHESLLEMHKVADSHGDAQLTDFIEGEYLKEQVEAQKEIGDLITKMKRAGDALGLHIIDKELQ